MRKGQNPAKSINQVAKPERITVAVLNYIPFVSGFFAEMPEVLKACLTSLRNNPGLPFDLMVFDNGSCEEIQQYLRDEKAAGRIQHLVLSEKNLGKGGAWNMIFGAAPGEIVAYADNDVFFYPGWLKRSVEILETYPNVGMVTARPFWCNPKLYSSTQQWAEHTDGVEIQKGQLIPWETFREFSASLGHSAKETEEGYATTTEVLVRYRNIQAFFGASHWQFTAYKTVMQQFLPFNMDKPMGQVRQLDERMNAAGYLRLMVSDPLVMNMSNTPLLTETKAPEERPTRVSAGKRLREFPPLKALLLRLYDRIFSWYYRD